MSSKEKEEEALWGSVNIADTGTVTVTLSGTNYQVSYGASDTSSTIAAAPNQSFGQDGCPPIRPVLAKSGNRGFVRYAQESRKMECYRHGSRSKRYQENSGASIPPLHHLIRCRRVVMWAR